MIIYKQIKQLICIHRWGYNKYIRVGIGGKYSAIHFTCYKCNKDLDIKLSDVENDEEYLKDELGVKL